MRVIASAIFIFVAAIGGSGLVVEAGEPPCETALGAFAVHDTVYVFQNQVTLGCNIGLSVEVISFCRTIILYESERLPRYVLPCLCCFDYVTVVPGLSGGLYHVLIVRREKEFERLEGELWVRVPGSCWQAQRDTSTSPRTMASPCGGFADRWYMNGTTWGRIKVLYR